MPLDLTRSLIVVLIPGALGLSGWLLTAIFLFPDLFSFYRDYENLFLGTVFIATVVAGLLFESLGTKLENELDHCLYTGNRYGWRAELRKRMLKRQRVRRWRRKGVWGTRWLKPRVADRTMYYEWFDYLSWMPDNEAVGFKFLGKKATTLYFNLTMVSAAPVASMGYAALAYVTINGVRGQGIALGLLVIGFGVSRLFRGAACSNQEAMMWTRREMNARFKEARVSPKNS